jgi:hypothetical protein
MSSAQNVSRGLGSVALARSALKGAAIASAALVLVLTVLEFPSVPFDIDHDLSSSASLEYFATRHVQFGTDLVQNVGPLGWLHYGYAYAGYLNAERLVLKSLARVALAMLVLWACTRFRSWAARIVWLLAFVAMIPIGSTTLTADTNEAFAYLSVYLAGLVLLGLPNGRGSGVSTVLALLFLAFLALMKHTLLVAATFVVCAALFERLRRREWRAALVLVGGYASCLLAIWVLAGQQLANLPAFAMGMFAFTGGYNEAMALPAVPPSTTLGLIALGGLATLIAIRTVRRTQSLAKSATDALFVFLVWKHAFVRADTEHVMIFFHTCAFLALLMGLAFEQPSVGASRDAPVFLVVTSLAVSLFCAFALLAVIPNADYVTARVSDLWERNLAWIAAPDAHSAQLARDLEGQKERFSLPELRRRVGDASIDFFGFSPGWLLLNGLNYVPRPMPISFAASNASLLRRNEAFYRDASQAPQFILAQLGSIDGRFVPPDDGLALGAILDNYRPSGFHDDLLLLERSESSQTRDHFDHTLLKEQEIGFGDPLSLSGFIAQWTWLDVDVQPTPLGRLRSLVLRPAPVWIVLDIEGREPERLRFVPSMGSAGFLVSPMIATTADLIAAYGSGGSAAKMARVRSVRFECDPQDQRFFEPRIVVRVRSGSPLLESRAVKSATGQNRD